MDQELMAIVDLADELQVRKQRIFKVLKRLGISAGQRRDVERRGQNVAVVTTAEVTAIRKEIERTSSAGTAEEGELFAFPDDIGFFYVIGLEPNVRPRSTPS
jgi:hypothetical protein